MITMNALRGKIVDERDKVDGLLLYRALRLFVSKRTDACMNLVKWFIAAERTMGEGNITVHLLCILTDKEYNNVLSQLHQLGDYGVTKACRTRGKILFFKMTDAFKDELNNLPLDDDFDIEAYWDEWRNKDNPIKIK